MRFCSHVRCTKHFVNNGICVEHGALVKCCNHAGCTKLVVLNKSASSMERFCSHDGCFKKFINFLKQRRVAMLLKHLEWVQLFSGGNTH